MSRGAKVAKCHAASPPTKREQAVRGLLRRLPGTVLPDEIADALLGELMVIATPLADDDAFIDRLDTIEPRIRAMAAGVRIAVAGCRDGKAISATPTHHVRATGNG